MKIISLSMLVLFFSCSKQTSTNNTATSITISNVSGTYSGGTLTWTNAYYYSPLSSTHGTDPNYSFVVNYLGNNTAKVIITTSAPLTIKEYTLPLTLKQEGIYPNINSYTFSVSNQAGIGVSFDTVKTYNFNFAISTSSNVKSTATISIENDISGLGNNILSSVDKVYTGIAVKQ